MWQWFVYLHRKADDGEPFYVGKGRLKKGVHERAFVTEKRSVLWARTFNKHGRIVEIVASCISDKAAQDIERCLIGEIGRRNLGLGPLVNLTDGGDGHAGLIKPAETLAKLSEHAKKPRGKAWIASMRAARKNGGNGGVVKHGDKLPEKWVQSLSRSKIGDKNPYFGKPSPPSKKVKNLHTGAVYDSISRAAAAEGLSVKALYQWLDGSRLNRSPLVRM
jgi:hypothetical protein